MEESDNVLEKLLQQKERKKFIFKEIRKYASQPSRRAGDNNAISKKIALNDRTEFDMFFTSQLSITYQLNIAECAILFSLLNRYVGTGNFIFLSASAKRSMQQDLEIDGGTISKCLKTLREKEIILSKENEKFDYLNPDIFGNGEWRKIEKLNHQYSYQYNFLSHEACLIYATTAEYMDEETIVKNLEEKELSVDKPRIKEELEIELQKEKNRELELNLMVLEKQLEIYYAKQKENNYRII